MIPKCHKNILFSVGLRDDWRGAPWTLYDYATASGGFAFWLDDAQKDEQQIIRNICIAGKYNPGSIVMGYAKSGDDLLATVNNYGIGYVVSVIMPTEVSGVLIRINLFINLKGKPERSNPVKYMSVSYLVTGTIFSSIRMLCI